MHLTNRQIRQIHTALAMLSARTLGSIKNELRVAKLRREYFAAPFEVTEDVRKKIIAANPVPDDADQDASMPVSVAEARHRAIEEMLDATQEIRDVPPHLILSEADMPVTLKSNPENRAGIADIIASLDFLYPLTDEEG